MNPPVIFVPSIVFLVSFERETLSIIPKTLSATYPNSPPAISPLIFTSFIAMSSIARFESLTSETLLNKILKNVKETDLD